MTTKNMFFEDDFDEKEEKKVVKQPKKSATKTEDVATLPENGHRMLDLPSKGQFGYPSSVEYRDILAKDEETLTSATSSSYIRTLNGVIKGVLGNCDFYEKLTTYDRDYALIWLWANNYNPVKSVHVVCEHCKHENSNIKVDLTELDIVSPDERLTGAFKMKLASTGKDIVVRMNTVQDEIDVEQYLSKFPDQTSKHDYLMRVCSIDLGMKLPMESKIKWVGENVKASEMNKIREFHKRFAYGVKTLLEHTCEGCGEVTHFDLPFSATDILLPHGDVGEVDFDFV